MCSLSYVVEYPESSEAIVPRGESTYPEVFGPAEPAIAWRDTLQRSETLGLLLTRQRAPTSPQACDHSIDAFGHGSQVLSAGRNINGIW